VQALIMAEVWKPK